MAKNIMGIPNQYLMYSGSGIVGMVGGSVTLWLVGKAIDLNATQLGMGITAGAAVGFLAGSYVGWKVYEKYR
jgi:hypothetical protein